MPGIHPSIICHKLAICPQAKTSITEEEEDGGITTQNGQRGSGQAPQSQFH